MSKNIDEYNTKKASLMMWLVILLTTKYLAQSQLNYLSEAEN